MRFANCDRKRSRRNLERNIFHLLQVSWSLLPSKMDLVSKVKQTNTAFNKKTFHIKH